MSFGDLDFESYEDDLSLGGDTNYDDDTVGGTEVDDAFSNLFSEDSVDENKDVENSDSSENNSKYVKVVVAGAVIVAIAIVSMAIVTKVKNTSKSSKDIASSHKESTSSVISTDTQSSTPADISRDRDASSRVTKPVNDTYNEEWSEITGKEKLDLNKEYTSMSFTVTDVKHLARVLDQSTINVKTQAKGSISGLAGTFIIDVPYSKGVHLNIGDTFSIMVKLGEYGGKTVVEDIYY